MWRTKITGIIGFIGVLIGALGQPQVMNLLPAKWSAIIAAVGAVLALVGRSILAPTNSPPANEVK